MRTSAWRLRRIALAAAFVVCVLAQVVAPVLAAQVGTNFPEVAYLVVPYAAAAILFIVCIEVALAAVWQLLTPVDGRVTLSRAVRWVEVIVASAVAATMLTAVVLVHLLAVVPGGGGPMRYYLAGCVAGGAAVVWVGLVKRRGLVSGIAAPKDLEAAR